MQASIQLPKDGKWAKDGNIHSNTPETDKGNERRSNIEIKDKIWKSKDGKNV